MAMVEDVPLLADLYDAPMVVAAVVRRLLRGLVRVDMEVVVADNHAAEGESARRLTAGRVAQLVHHD